MKDKINVILKNKNIAKSILILALPIMFSNILKSIHDIVDISFIGNQNITKEIIETQVSAITLTTPIIQIFQAISMGISIAGTSIMSQFIGAKEEKKAKSIGAQLIIASIFLGILSNLILFIFTNDILRLMNIVEDTNLYNYASIYLKYRSFEFLFLFIFYAFQSIRQSIGDTVTPVILNVISILVNVILTWIFIYKMNMGIKGAALSTIIANIIIFPCIIIILSNKKNHLLTYKIKDLKINKNDISELFKNGIPSSVSYITTSLAFMIINSIITRFDTSTIYAVGISNRINSLMLLPSMAIGSVTTTFIGQNIGADNIKRSQKSLRCSMIIVSIMTILLGLVLFITKNFFIQIFVQKDLSIEAFEKCQKFLSLLIISFPFMGILQVWIGYFQGIGKISIGSLLSIIRLWVFRLPILLWMMNILNLGIFSVYYSMIISNALVIILGLILYKKIKPNMCNIKTIIGG